MAWSENIKEVLSCGIPLLDFGINNWALNRSQSLLALVELKKRKISILGGDVYEIVNNMPESNNDNWYCNRHDNEALEDFVDRSINDASDYISSYVNPSGRKTLFVLVARETGKN